MRIACLILFLFSLPAFAANSTATFTGLTLVPTFNCIGVYTDYTGDDNSNSVASVQYRISGVGAYKSGLPLWRDGYRNKHVGSIVYLSPGTPYEVVVTVSDADGVSSPASLTNAVTTWTDPSVWAIESTAIATNITAATTLTTGGSSLNSYIAYGPASGRVTCSVATNNNVALTVTCDNVIIRNIDFTLGGYRNAIQISNNHTNVLIDRCTFRNYGPTGKGHGPGTFPDEYDDAAILVGRSTSGTASGVSRVVIQNCDIGDSAGGSNSWDEGHPTGPHGVYMSCIAGQCVVRYNVIHGSTNHYFNDGVSGNVNFGTQYGNATKDCDFYGNIVSEVYDDAFEIEGPDENARVWGNYITNSNTGISSAGVTIGPLYDFRNIFVNSYFSETNSALHGYYAKMGWTAGPQRARFSFHNTACNPHRVDNFYANAGGVIDNCHGSNNIANTEAKTLAGATNVDNSFDYDLIKSGATYDGPTGVYAHAVTGDPVFTSGAYATNIGSFFLTAASPGYHAGTSIPNFSDDSAGVSLANPNIGALDERFPALTFGIIPNTSFNVTTLNIGTWIPR